ncbi:MAG: MBL fold metallo-hydrolase [Bacteroidota bacterium]
MKKTALFLILCYACIHHSLAQNSPKFILNKYSPEISFVVMDTVHGAQSTVIEYPHHLVLIEVPMIDEGGGKQTNLDEDTMRASQYKEFLAKNFKGKPVKYILSSHWHLHSLSGVTPFTKSGTKIITTAGNWRYATTNKLLANHHLASIGSSIIKVSSDTMILPKSEFPIRVLYIDTSYHHKPTRDYLFFYLTKQQFLHASCMAAIGTDDFSKTGNYVYNGRLIDFYRAISSRKLKVNKVIRLGRERISGGSFTPGVYDYEAIERYIVNGKSSDQIIEPIKKLSVQQIKSQTDSLLHYMINTGLSPGMLNALAYDCMSRKQYEKALVIAQLLNIYFPGEKDFIDSMGEAYYLNGDFVLAKRISDMLGKNDPNWRNRYAEWEKNKKENSL